MKKFQLVALAVAVAFAVNCSKKEKSDNSAIMLLLADQLSGNCANIVKSGSSYSVTITGIPKGACKASYTAAEQLAATQTYYAGISNAYAKAGSTCDTLRTANTTLSSNLTASTFTATTSATVQAQSVSNGITEASATLAIAPTYGYAVSTTEQAASKLASVDDLFAAVAYQTAMTSTSFATCAAALLVAYPNVATISSTTLYYTYGKLSTTYTKPSAPQFSSVSCIYPTATSSTGKCATLAPSF
ncbi:MAG: hypothetical protein IT569_02565 [Leptospiraceae bacterium]|nr:hypothetical protein [Leptospiraceae bacterium]